LSLGIVYPDRRSRLGKGSWLPVEIHHIRKDEGGRNIGRGCRLMIRSDINYRRDLETNRKS
jgi:hypothetical protein